MWEYLLNNIGVLVAIIIAIVVVIVLITLFFVFWLPKLKNRPKKVKEVKEEPKGPDALNYDMNKNQIDNEIALQETKVVKEEVKELKGKDIEDKIKNLQHIGRK